MIKALLKEQKDYINAFFDQLDLEKSETILQKLLKVKGTIVFTGVGKSGIIAQKLAMSFLSTGTKALYMPSTDAMHGDLGLLGKEDVFIFLSKSGNTEELVRLLPYVKNKKAFTISWVSNPSSKLFEHCDLSIHLPVKRELCPFDLAPTTSSEVQLLYGDLLAVAMMMKKNFTLKDYAKNHPAGSIGKKLFLTVEDVMRKGSEIPICYFGEKLLDLLYRLSEKKSGCLFVSDQNQSLLGIFSDEDLREAMDKFGPKALEKNVETLMRTSPKFLEKHLLAIDALSLMENASNTTSVLPVVDQSKIVGIIRLHDILQAL